MFGLCINQVMLGSSADQVYNIPIRIWLQRGYPKEKPAVCINPTADMAVAAAVGYVSEQGMVDLNHLPQWKEVLYYISQKSISRGAE